jgi:hypothetical protein
MKILFLTTILPVKARTGGEFVSQLFVNSIKSLGYEVDILGYSRINEVCENVPPYMHLAKRIIIESNTSKCFTIINIVKSFFYKRCYSSQKYVTKKYIELLKKNITKNNYSAIIIDHFQMGWVLKYLPKNIKIISISHNVESDLYKQLSEEGGYFSRVLYQREAYLMQQLENKVFTASQFVWLLTDNNKKRYLKLLPGINEKNLKAVCISSFNKRDGQIVIHEKEGDIGMIGSWTWDANNKGLMWFFKEVYPHLPNSLSIQIAGLGAEWLQDKYNNVRYLGFVDSADDFILKSKVVAIPSIAGNGIQTKTIHAISLGQNIVATPFAVRGIDNLPSYIRLAAKPTEFASMLVSSIAEKKNNHCEEAKQWNETRNAQFLASISEFLES